MSTWGRNDQAVTANSTTTRETSNGAPIGTYVLVKGDQTFQGTGANSAFGNTSPGSRANVDVRMFNNITMGAFIPNMAVGIFGVDATEASVANGGIATAVLTFAGSGYPANATVTVTAVGTGSSGVVNAFANATTGRIQSLLIQAPGSGYDVHPNITVAAPPALTFNGNTLGVNVTSNFITLGGNAAFFANGDVVQYLVGTGNTALGGLANGASYFVINANTSALQLSNTFNSTSTPIDITSAAVTPQPGHSLTGQRATGEVTVGGAKNNGVAHAGWVVRREGSGGRAGRVHYETLVAMGSLGAQTAAFGTPALVADASDDTILPDS